MKYLKLILVIGVAVFSYLSGHDKAEDEYLLKLSDEDRLHQRAIIDAQKREKEKYEQQTKALIAKFNADAEHSAQRVRQLEAKLRSGGDLEAVTGERDRCLALAVRGERLLGRADGFIESLIEK